MERSIAEINFEIEREYDKISAITQEKYSSHLQLLNHQYELLFEFLTNYFEYDNLKHDDPNQFILCYSLFSEMIRKQQITIQLILRGDYCEASELIRHIMQSSFQIAYLAKHKDSWKDWFEQQVYEEGKFKNGLKNPHTIFANFHNLLDSLEMLDYYKPYQKLCSLSHPSIESLRSNLIFEKEGINRYFFINRFSEEKSESLLNFLFGLINQTYWSGLANISSTIGLAPETIIKYEELQKEATKIFDKFYSADNI